MNTSAITPVLDELADRFHKLTDTVSSSLARRTSSYGRISSGRIIGASALVLGLVAGGVVAVKLLKQAARRKEQEQVEHRHDKSLKQSFPASDPPASQYFDIPVNRQ